MNSENVILWCLGFLVVSFGLLLLAIAVTFLHSEYKESHYQEMCFADHSKCMNFKNTSKKEIELK